MNTLRKTVGKTRVDRAIRKQRGMQPIGLWVNKRREEWHNHASNITENRIVWVSEITSQKAEEAQ
jgi:hypothetical protein